MTVCAAVAACEAAGEGQAAFDVLAPYLDDERPSFLAGLAPACAAAMRALARTGALREAWAALKAGRLPSDRRSTARRTLRFTRRRPTRMRRIVRTWNHWWRKFRWLPRRWRPTTTRRRRTRNRWTARSRLGAPLVTHEPPCAMFVLEGAQVSPPRRERIVAERHLPDARRRRRSHRHRRRAREARSLVYHLRRSGRYTPILPRTRVLGGGRGRLSLSRRRGCSRSKLRRRRSPHSSHWDTPSPGWSSAIACAPTRMRSSRARRLSMVCASS